MRRLSLLLMCAATAAVPARAAAQMGANEAIQAIAGVVGTGAGVMGLGLAGLSITASTGDADPDLSGAVVGAIVGAGVGSALGVSLSGALLNGDARIRRTALGAAFGVGAIVGLAAATRVNADDFAFWVAFATIPTAGAMLGYHGLAPLRNLAVLPGTERAALALRLAF